MDNKLELQVENGIKELVVREGSAMPVKEPIAVSINGTISAPSEFLEKRKKDIEINKCYVLFSYLEMRVNFCVNENDPYRTMITGQTKLNPDLEKFGINKGKTYTIKELKQFLKMNRVFFADIDANMKMVTNLEKFSASIQTQVDNHSNDRGDKKQNLEVKIDSNLDLNFTLNMPIFIGELNARFVVEVCCDYLDGSTTVWLESPGLQALIVAGRIGMVDKAIKPFKDYKIVVIEQ